MQLVLGALLAFLAEKNWRLPVLGNREKIVPLWLVGFICARVPPSTITMQKNKILSFLFTIQGCLYVNLRRYRI